MDIFTPTEKDFCCGKQRQREVFAKKWQRIKPYLTERQQDDAKIYILLVLDKVDLYPDSINYHQEFGDFWITWKDVELYLDEDASDFDTLFVGDTETSNFKTQDVVNALEQRVS